MLTKNLVLPTDRFLGAFCPEETPSLMEGKVLEIPLVW